MHVYEERLRARRAEAATLAARERRLAIARLIVAAIAVATIFVAWRWVLLPIAAFVALMVVHDRAITRRRRAERAAKFYERGVERLTDQWMGRGTKGDEFFEEHHPFASDLDLFGSGSLFELICIAVTGAGRARLAAWLKEPALARTEVESRQVAVRELRDRLDLREEIDAVAGEIAHDVEAAKLDQWAAQPPMPSGRGERTITLAVSIVIGMVVAISIPIVIARLAGLTHPGADFGGFGRLPIWPLVVAIIVGRILAMRLGGRVGPVIAAVERAEPALAMLASLLERIERETFAAPRLIALRAALNRDGAPASAQIDRLRRLVALLDARRNQFFAPLALLVLWSENIAFAIERWRQESGRDVARWIGAVAEIEALLSLSSFAYEHPHFATPQIVDGPPEFFARSLGHPLIPASRRITNDVPLAAGLRLLVVSGSNMSGKSTLMRSVGVAAVLALAGGPVCASSLRIAPLRIGASIRLHDSLMEGASRFYAEILRIRQILELAEGDAPLLFLLDEILHGTNSHDRRIGAEAIVRGLVTRGAIGLVSTHDLALTEIVPTLGKGALNVHFEDHMEEGRIAFDYRMRPGVVEKSNALALMRAVGIEV